MSETRVDPYQDEIREKEKDGYDPYSYVEGGIQPLDTEVENFDWRDTE